MSDNQNNKQLVLGITKYSDQTAKFKQSTYVARERFLKVVLEIKPYVVKDLLRLSGTSESLPLSATSKLRQIEPTKLFLLYFARSESMKKTFPMEWQSIAASHAIETPFGAYLDFLQAKKSYLDPLIEKSKKKRLQVLRRSIRKNMSRAANPDFKKASFDENRDNYKNSRAILQPEESTDYEKDAIEKIIPNWQALKKDDSGKALCSALESWADKWNLKVEWILDFALNVLKLHKLRVVDGIADHTQDANKFLEGAPDEYSYNESYIPKSWQEPYSDLWWKNAEGFLLKKETNPETRTPLRTNKPVDLIFEPKEINKLFIRGGTTGNKTADDVLQILNISDGGLSITHLPNEWGEFETSNLCGAGFTLAQLKITLKRQYAESEIVGALQILKSLKRIIIVEAESKKPEERIYVSLTRNVIVARLYASYDEADFRKKVESSLWYFIEQHLSKNRSKFLGQLHNFSDLFLRLDKEILCCIAKRQKSNPHLTKNPVKDSDEHFRWMVRVVIPLENGRPENRTKIALDNNITPQNLYKEIKKLNTYVGLDNLSSGRRGRIKGITEVRGRRTPVKK